MRAPPYFGHTGVKFRNTGGYDNGWTRSMHSVGYYSSTLKAITSRSLEEHSSVCAAWSCLTVCIPDRFGPTMLSGGSSSYGEQIFCPCVSDFVSLSACTGTSVQVSFAPCQEDTQDKSLTRTQSSHPLPLCPHRLIHVIGFDQAANHDQAANLRKHVASSLQQPV